MEGRIGFYNQTDLLTYENRLGLAVEIDGCIATVNLPSRLGDFCEFICIANTAYIDLNNCPWAVKLLEDGICTDTGYTKRSGFCEYPLWQFDAEWLKSLKPIDKDYTYERYIKQYQFEEDDIA